MTGMTGKTSRASHLTLIPARRFPAPRVGCRRRSGSLSNTLRCLSGSDGAHTPPQTPPHTHTHTYTLSISLKHTLSLSLSLTHTISLHVPQTHSLSHTHT